MDFVDTDWRSGATAIDALRQYIACYSGQRLHSVLAFVSRADFEHETATCLAGVYDTGGKTTTARRSALVT